MIVALILLVAFLLGALVGIWALCWAWTFVDQELEEL